MDYDPKFNRSAFSILRKLGHFYRLMLAIWEMLKENTD